jgi:hypothetical protein
MQLKSVDVIALYIYTHVLLVHVSTTYRKISAKSDSMAGNTQSTRCDSFIPDTGCQFDLPHVPRRAVVSRYIPRRAFDIVTACLTATMLVDVVQISYR